MATQVSDGVGALKNAETLRNRGIFRNASVPQTSSLARYFVPTYNASIDLRQPWFGSPHNELGLSFFSHRRSAPGIYVDRGYGTSATFTREIAQQAPASANYRFEISKVDAGDVYFCINYGVCDQPTLEALRGNQKLTAIEAAVPGVVRGLWPRASVGMSRRLGEIVCQTRRSLGCVRAAPWSPLAGSRCARLCRSLLRRADGPDRAALSARAAALGQKIVV